jgi:uncharacterized membrane protein
MFPTLPPWEGMHPIFVHFPVALLITAPIFIILGLFRKEMARAFFFAAFVLFLLGALGSSMAAMSGEDARDSIAPEILATASQDMPKVLQHNQELAEWVVNLAFAVTVLMGLFLLLKRFLKERYTPKIEYIALAVVLLVWIGLALLMMNAAHEGARLVHEFGVRAVMR